MFIRVLSSAAEGWPSGAAVGIALVIGSQACIYPQRADGDCNTDNRGFELQSITGAAEGNRPPRVGC